MNLLHMLVESSFAGALGWTLLHSLWEGAVIATVLGGVLVCTQSPRARYAAGCAALLSLAAGFGVTLAQMITAGGQGIAVARLPGASGWTLASGAGSFAPFNPGLDGLVPWLAPLWLAGVWIFALRHAAGWISVSRLRHRGVCCVPERWQQELAGLRARLGVSRPVLLLESCLAEAPMVLGHLRPVILVPIGLLAGLPPEQVEAILLHELAHIRRSDYLVNVMQRAAECLFFYHPAAWWFSRVIRNERESCCDDVAVTLGGDAHGYALALAALEERRSNACEPAVAAKGGNLMKRILRLLYPERTSGAWTPVLAGVIIVATVAAGLALWPQAQSAFSAAQQQPRSIELSPSKGWLEGPVSYIITPGERAAYEKLPTEAERDQFIKQFWERRNPNPGSKTNAFRAEFYRRINYADAHFGVGYPGWKSDRGHLYILYGPPDEIESHPADSPHGYEDWMYNDIPGLGKHVFFRFIDEADNGDLRLQYPPWKK